MRTPALLGSHKKPESWVTTGTIRSRKLASGMSTWRRSGHASLTGPVPCSSGTEARTVQPSVGSHGPSCGQGLPWPLTGKQVSIPREAPPSRVRSPALVRHQGKGAPPSEISTSLGAPVCAGPSRLRKSVANLRGRGGASRGPRARSINRCTRVCVNTKAGLLEHRGAWNSKGQGLETETIF